MNSFLRKLVFVIAFVIVTLILPTIVMLLFVDTTSSFSTYIVVYGIIIFAICGYTVSSVMSMEKKLDAALEEIKMQNAAIAYKLSNGDNEFNDVKKSVETNTNTSTSTQSTLNVPLNPAEPLVVTKSPKKVDDSFDDFK